MPQGRYSSAHATKTSAFDPEIFALFLEHRKFFMALERKKYEEARRNKSSSN
jgi:hypothetical protein